MRNRPAPLVEKSGSRPVRPTASSVARLNASSRSSVFVAGTPRPAQLAEQRAGEEPVDAVFAGARVGGARCEHDRAPIVGQRVERRLEPPHAIVGMTGIDQQHAEARARHGVASASTIGSIVNRWPLQKRSRRSRSSSAAQYPRCASMAEAEPARRSGTGCARRASIRAARTSRRSPKASRSAERTVAPFASRFTPMESR